MKLNNETLRNLKTSRFTVRELILIQRELEQKEINCRSIKEYEVIEKFRNIIESKLKH